MKKRTTYKKNCDGCLKEYDAWNKTQRFCSAKCSGKYLSQIKKGVLKPRGNRKKVVCASCNTIFEKWNNDIVEGRLNFCSRQCTPKHKKSIDTYSNNGKKNKGRVLDKVAFKKRNLRRGVLHHFWKGGVTYFKRKGLYVNYKIKYVKCPVEFLPMSRKDGYIMEHRLLVAQREGRCLSRIEVVHHIDHNPENNDINNLMLFPNNAEHKKYEAKNRN